MPLGNAEFHVMDKKQTLYEIQNLDAEYVHPRSDLLIWYGADVLSEANSVAFYGIVCCTRILSMEMLML